MKKRYKKSARTYTGASTVARGWFILESENNKSREEREQARLLKDFLGPGRKVFQCGEREKERKR